LIPATIHYWVGRVMTEYGIPILFTDKTTTNKILPWLFETSFKRAQEIKSVST